MLQEDSSLVVLLSKRVVARMESNGGTFGIDWAAILAIIVPIILDCFQSPRQLYDAMQSQPNQLQLFGLRLRVRRNLASRVRGLVLPRAVSSVVDAILVEANLDLNEESLRGLVEARYGTLQGIDGRHICELIWQEANEIGGE